jgi:formylglycine-generating enzyme required for sulfatase activity
MGAPEGEEGSEDHERPVHRVTLGEFLLGQTPVTQAQWRAVAEWQPTPGEAPWDLELDPDTALFKGANRPVERVSWFEAEEFCRRLRRRTGKNYRLPTEVQWEYACRAGTTTPFHFGRTITSELANYDGSVGYGEHLNTQSMENPYASFTSPWESYVSPFESYTSPSGTYKSPLENHGGQLGDSVFQVRHHGLQTTNVASFPANAWGLHDMHGNVWEWCGDPWHEVFERASEAEKAWLLYASIDKELIPALPAENQEKLSTLSGNKMQPLHIEARLNSPVIVAGSGHRQLLRGGAWGFEARSCRSASRNLAEPEILSGHIGLRVCCLPAG